MILSNKYYRIYNSGNNIRIRMSVFSVILAIVIFIINVHSTGNGLIAKISRG